MPKIAAKYAQINRIGSLDARFQQVPLVQNFLNFLCIVTEHQYFKVSEKKQKIFFNKTNPKIQFTITLVQTHFRS